MIIGNFYYDIGTDTYSGEIRTLTVQRRGLALRPLAKRHEREPDYRVIEMTEAGLVELGAAWRKRTDRGRDYLSVILEDPTFGQPLSAALFLAEDDRTATLVWSRQKEPSTMTAPMARAKTPTARKAHSFAPS